MSKQVLTGLAIGDALGQPFEFCSLKHIAQSNWDGSFLSGGTWKHKAGQWTDDTKMARALAESLVNMKRFDQKDVADKYLAWFKSGDLRGIGQQTERAMSAYAAGTSLDKIGLKETASKRPSFIKRQGASFDNHSDVCGNGTVMRCAPIALAIKDTTAMLEAARLDANITHNHPLARDVSQALCMMIHRLLLGDCPQEAYVRMKSVTFEYPHLPKMFKRVDEVLGEEPNLESILALGVRGTAHETLASAVYCFLSSSDYKTAVVKAILPGGDTDTRAAIVGAMAATVWEIPAEYLEQVEDSEALQLLDLRLNNL